MSQIPRKNHHTYLDGDLGSKLNFHCTHRSSPQDMRLDWKTTSVRSWDKLDKSPDRNCLYPTKHHSNATRKQKLKTSSVIFPVQSGEITVATLPFHDARMRCSAEFHIYQVQYGSWYHLDYAYTTDPFTTMISRLYKPSN